MNTVEIIFEQKIEIISTARSYIMEAANGKIIHEKNKGWFAVSITTLGNDLVILFEKRSA